MKKLLVLLAMVLAFTVTSVAQYGSSSTSQTSGSDQSSSGQTSSDQTTSGKKSKKSAGSSDQMGATSDTGTKKGKAKKEASLTGCLSAQPDSSGNFMLSNGKFKKGVQVEPADKIKDHAGHQVQLKGEWQGSGADKKFEVASLKHLSETCKEAPGGGTTGETKKGKKDTQKGKTTGATPPQ